MIIYFLQGCQGYTMRIGQSFQQIVLEKLNIHKKE